MLKYEYILNDLVKHIDNADYAPGSKLPTATELCELYGVSKITIKKVMDGLEALGMITRRRGAGTRVKSAQRGVSRHLGWGGPTGITGTKTQFARQGIEVESHVHEFSVIEPPEDIANELNMDEGFVYKIVRSRHANGLPICVEYTYMPIDLIPGITLDVLHDSIYQYIENTLGLDIDSAHTTIRATLPTPEECEWLGIDENYPLLEVEQTAFLADGRSFEYSITHNTRNDNEVRIVRSHHLDERRQ